jgi:CheY-like chemotaxis protein
MALLDILMPDMLGYEVLKEIRGFVLIFRYS